MTAEQAFSATESKPEARSSSWFVYLIETHKGHFYTGITTDVTRRFQEHCDAYAGMKNAKGAKYFRSNQPIRVVYTQSYSSRSEASVEEARIKKLPWQEKRALAQTY